ncbi:MAG: NrfD/PsrC family molybdoenzyme membrane anchor subunit [Candidatus Hatepunaea meridiana]|nr:NrfD/PsrC family molybdoenzyme membrane anchor subunit [Candidatus Hatepunaea meridiana]
MYDKIFYGNKGYWTWLIFLAGILFIGFLAYLKQFNEGLYITGLSRDVSWGFYIAQFTFLVGVAASAVMVVLPYYLHNYKAFGKITILGEFLAIPAVIMCMTFIFVDMGQPFRILNVFLHPSLKSVMFWDTVALFGYLVLNIFIGFITLGSERKSIAPPKWIKPIIILSIPWAISIHTVTAFLYAGLAARPFWMTAVLAPRFLASAFASGPALLILFVLLLRKLTKFDAGKEAVQKLAVIATYAMCFNVFLILMEVFTAFYSGISEHSVHFKYMFVGVEGHNTLVPWMWTSSILAIITLIFIIPPSSRRNEKTLVFACITLFISIWIDKGMGMIVAGYVPNPLGKVVEYFPTVPELLISLGVYAMGALIITLLYKIALSVKTRVA